MSGETSAKLSFIPLYEQVKKAILERIIQGEWGPGSFLPSEIALAGEYGISQGTLRKALNELTREKRLVRYQGKGTAVSIMDQDCDLFHFFMFTDASGKRIYPVSQIYSVSEGAASAEEMESLHLSKTAIVLHIDRVRFLNDRPVINERVALPKDLFPDFGKTLESVPNALYECYQVKHGITVAKAIEKIEAALPDASDMANLGVPQGQPMLVVSRVAYDLKGRPVERRVSHINTAHDFVYKIEIN